MNEPGGARDILRERPFWLLLAAVVLFFFEPLTTGTFYARDIYLLFYGHKAFLADALRNGHIPLWDPLVHGGQPFVGEPANSFYYPTTILFAILPAIVALNVAIVLQYVLCAATAYFLGRTLRLSPWAAFVCGVTYAFCGYTLSAANLTVLMLAMPWPPLLLAATHRLIEEGRRRWLVVAASAGALMLLAGAAELAAMSFGTVALWALLVPHAPGGRRAGWLFAVLAFAIALSAAQTFPAAEVIRNSSRSMKRDYATFVQWSVHPHRLPEIVVPRFFGPTNRAARADYWGGIFEMEYPYIFSIYFGVPVLLLAVFGAIAGETVRRRGRLLLGAVAILGLVLSIGGWLPFFSVIYDWVPLVSIFRFPVKALLLSLVPIALLAGCGADALRARWRGVAIAAASLSGVLFLFALLLAMSAGFRDAFGQTMFLRKLPPSAAVSLAASFAHAAIAAALLAICAAVRRIPPQRVPAFVAAIVLLDLATAGFTVNSYAPRQLFDRPPLADTVGRLTASGGRLWREQGTYRIRISAPTGDAVWVAWYELQLLGRYTAATFGIPTVFGDDYDGLAPLRISRGATVIRKLPWPAKLPLLSAAGVTAILTNDAVDLPGLQHAGTYRDMDGKPLFLYANRNAQPVRFASIVERAADDGDAFRRIASRPFDPQRVVITGAVIPSAARCGTGSIAITSRTSDDTTVDVTAPCNGWVVFPDSWYRGWRATVDGRAATVALADYAFSAVAVPAGHHVVRKEYRPRAVAVGFGLSCLAAILLFGTAFASRLHRLKTDSRIAPPERSGTGIHQGT